MADVVPLGSRLRQRREELGLTQAQAAKQLDVARTAYRLWEMEAAKPAPDRWRNIARWLGISMTALLLAEELIDQQEALEAGRAASDSGLSEAQWDAQSETAAGSDFFAQERAMIADQARRGEISAAEAANLGRVLSRVQGVAATGTGSTWHPGEFRKRFPNDEHAPALARAALAATAVGIPIDAFEDTVLLISELVSNGVRHSRSEWIEVAIAVGADALRVEVSDRDRQTVRPRTSDLEGGWGLTLVGELATRWGVERRTTGKTVWFEYDLTGSD